jgi:hypothetical protein
MSDEALKVLATLKDPVLIFAVIALGCLTTGLYWLIKAIYWLTNAKDKAVLEVVGKIDNHTDSVVRLTTMIDTLISVGRIK